MRSFERWVHGTLAFLAAFAQPASAQQNAALIAPIEVLSCQFVEGKGQGDVDRLAADFNGWMEQSAAPAYAAYALTPLAHSTEIEFDLAWVGAWPDGTTMGESMAHYFARGAQLGPILAGVIDCKDNRNFSTVTLRHPAAPGRFGPMEVTTCTLRLGTALSAALQAAARWVEHTATFGSTAAHWLLFPAYGERSDAAYTFKWAVGYESFEAFGRDYDQLTNGDGRDKYTELFELVARCDSPRLYSVRTIRAPQQ